MKAKAKRQKPKIEKKDWILVNGSNISHDETSLSFMLAYMLNRIDFKNSRMFVIRRNLRAVYFIMKSYCLDKKLISFGREKAKYTRMIKAIENQEDIWLNENKKEVLQKRYYDYLLYAENLGTLHGFGVRGVMGNLLYNNPEKTCLTKMANRI